MGWYDSSWKFRAPVLCNPTGTAATDIKWVIPAGAAHFWDNVIEAGDDIRITEADGTTLLTYEVTDGSYTSDSFSAAAKDGGIEIDNWTPKEANASNLLWMYYGNSGASNADTNFAIGTNIAAYMPLECPGAVVVQASLEAPGSTVPRQRVQKGGGEQMLVWFDITGLLLNYCWPSEGHLQFEEAESVNIRVLDTNGADQTALYTESSTAFTESRGRRYLGVYVKAGTDATDYTIAPIITTHRGRVWQPRVTLKIYDVLG